MSNEKITDDDLLTSGQAYQPRTIQCSPGDSPVQSSPPHHHSSEQPNQPLEPGRYLGEFRNYRLVKHLDSGGMGQVWLADDIKGGEVIRQVVCKILPVEVKDDSKEMKQILQVFSLTQSLNHENICPLYSMDKDPQYGRFFVMGYASGPTLWDWFNSQPGSGNGVDVQKLLPIFKKIACALDYAHQHNVIHRDVKPQNIMFAEKDNPTTPWLLDFGIAARVHQTVTATMSADRSCQGTPAYMSPEQCRADQDQDSRVDVYSFAAMAYHLLSGSLPFVGNPVSLADQIRHKQPSRIQHLSDAVNAVLLKGMAKNKADRFSTCGDFVTALADACEHGRAPVKNGGQFFVQTLSRVLTALAVFAVCCVVYSIFYGTPKADPPTVVSPAVQEPLPVVSPVAQEELPVVSAMVQEELPVVSPVAQEELPVVSAAVQEELPVVSPTVQEESAVVSPAVQEPLPVVSAAVQEELPVVSPTVQEELPVVSPTVQEESAVVSPMVQEELPVVSPVVQEELPVVSPTVQEPLPVVSAAVQEELPVVSPTVQEELPVVSPVAQEELPVVSPVAQEELPVVSPMVQEELPVVSPVAQEELPVVSPMVQEESAVVSPAVQEPLPVVSPAAQKQMTVVSPAAQKQTTVVSPAAQKQSTVVSPAAQKQSAVVSPAAQKQSAVVSPAVQEESAVVSPAAQKTRRPVSPVAQKR